MANSTYKKYLPIGVAVAAGALLLYYSRKASAAPAGPKPVGPAEPPVEPVPVEPKKPSGSTKEDAPSFPHSLIEAKAIEHGQATAEHAEWMAYMGGIMEENGNPGPSPTEEDFADARKQYQIPKWRTIPGVLTDEAFDVLYGKGITIPSKGDRGQGWQPFIDSWVRMQDYLKTQTWVSG